MLQQQGLSEGDIFELGELLPLYLWRCLTEFWSAALGAVWLPMGQLGF